MITINRTSGLEDKMSNSGSTTNLLMRHGGSISNSPDKMPRNSYLNNLASSAH